MEFGVLYDMRNPPYSGISNAELYAETLEHIEAVEELGFDTVWLTEHHFIDDEYLPSVLPMAAAVAARTSGSRSGRPCCCCRCTIRRGSPRTPPSWT